MSNSKHKMCSGEPNRPPSQPIAVFVGDVDWPGLKPIRRVNSSGDRRRHELGDVTGMVVHAMLSAANATPWVLEAGAMIGTGSDPRRSAHLARVVVALEVACLPHLAHAQESAADVSAARTLAAEGVKLANAGQCEEAINRLSQAQKLHPAPTILGSTRRVSSRASDVRGGYRELAAGGSRNPSRPGHPTRSLPRKPEPRKP